MDPNVVKYLRGIQGRIGKLIKNRNKMKLDEFKQRLACLEWQISAVNKSMDAKKLIKEE